MSDTEATVESAAVNATADNHNDTAQQAPLGDVESDGDVPPPPTGDDNNTATDAPDTTTNDDDSADALDAMKRAVRSYMEQHTNDDSMTFKTIKNALKQSFKKKQIKQYNDAIKQYVSDVAHELQAAAARESTQAMNIDALPGIGDDEVGDVDDEDYNNAVDGDDDDWGGSNKKAKKSSKIPRKRGSKSGKQRGGDGDDGGSGSKKSSSRKTGPRNPRTAFAFYKDEMRQHTSNVEEVREQWLNMTDEEKEPYAEKAKQDKQRYKVEMDELKGSDPELFAEMMSKRKNKLLDDDTVPTELDQAMRAVKSRRHNQFDEDDASVDEVVAQLITQMDNAYNQDMIAVNNNKPAVHKLQLLPVVENLCSNSHIWTVLRTDGKILRCFRDWLSYDKQQLPNIKLRSTIYELCNKNQINSDDLESSIGSDESDRSKRGVALSEMLMNLYFHPNETQANKKALRQILERWIRLVISGGEDGALPMTYKQLEQAERVKHSQIQMRRQELSEQKGMIIPAAIKAKFPERAAFDYVYRPVSNVNVQSRSEEAEERDMGIDDRRTQMNKKLAARQKTANVKKAAYKVDMAGRRTG